MTEFKMPTAEEIAKMTCMDVENVRVECNKTITELKNHRFTVKQSINDLSRQEHAIKTKKIDLGEMITQASIRIDELKTDAEQLKSIFFNKKDGF